MTASSGPGLSLMAEAAGLSYFAEIPTVMWNVQRMGPSTGLPTRNSQGDLMAAHTLSHGDTKHPVLIPGHPGECFEFARMAFDVAERLQTFTVVLSDLDIGMNFWIDDEFQESQEAFDRGKVLSAQDLEKLDDFARYRDVDGDGIPYRTLPGTENDKAAYFTRGTGHDETSAYTESPEVYQNLMDRLNRKMQEATKYLPEPISENRSSSLGIIAYGSSDIAVREARAQLKKDGVETSYLRVRALPFHKSVEDFIETHDKVYIIEQNRDAQMKKLLQIEYPELSNKLISILHYDGMPLPAEKIVPIISEGSSS